jgi:hypothetical protein
MWAMTTAGFFSTTASPRRKGYVQVRARSRKDLVHLMEMNGARNRIVETPVADYPFRVVVRPTTWARWMRNAALDAEGYNNFKATVDLARAGTYHRVWKILQEIEGESMAYLTKDKKRIVIDIFNGFDVVRRRLVEGGYTFTEEDTYQNQFHGTSFIVDRPRGKGAQTRINYLFEGVAR